MVDATIGNPSVLLAVVTFFASMLAMYFGILRFGPRRGNWGSPAAQFRPPGKGIGQLLMAVGAVHLVVGIVLAVALPSGVRLGVLGASVGMAGFYLLASQAIRIARYSPKAPVERGWDGPWTSAGSAS